jgi:hypothetical protein
MPVEVLRTGARERTFVPIAMPFAVDLHKMARLQLPSCQIVERVVQ